MRIAVIGSGAAAFGVLDRLAAVSEPPEVTLVDRGEPGAPAHSPDDWRPEDIRRLYRELRSTHGTTFPPPKTNFGLAPSKRKVEGWGAVWDSGHYGGLTNLWGLSCVPFTDDDLRGWPIGRQELAPHYAAVAARVGIAGRHDSLNEWIGDDYVNRPPVPVPPIVTALADSINRCDSAQTYRVVAGATRLAVETRPDQATACTACGECMLGCPRGAMHSTVPSLDAWRATGLVSRVVEGRALAIDRDARAIHVEAGNGTRETLGPYDRIYSCAGCLGTTEIVMRSLGMTEGPLMTDNSVYTFPLVSTRGAPAGPYDQRRYLALTNLLVWVAPRHPNGPSAQIQVYVIFDHLWRYFLPPQLWSLFAPLASSVRRRLLLARLFLHGEYSQRYALRVETSRPASLHLAAPGTALKEIPGLWGDIKATFGCGGFRAVGLALTRQKTSSHYSGSLPLGKGPVGLDASIARGVYLCDSSVFPTAPATSPTFTIMANARRITDESLR